MHVIEAVFQDSATELPNWQTNAAAVCHCFIMLLQTNKMNGSHEASTVLYIGSLSNLNNNDLLIPVGSLCTEIAFSLCMLQMHLLQFIPNQLLLWPTYSEHLVG
jgi:hypothetical protein